MTTENIKKINAELKTNENEINASYIIYSKFESLLHEQALQLRQLYNARDDLSKRKCDILENEKDIK
jgi:hypothetical protein